MPAVLVFSEDDALRGELSAKAATLGSAHEATLASLALPDANSDTIALGLKAAAEKVGATLVLVGATKKGKDIGPRLAGFLDWPFAAEAQAIAGGSGWTVERMVLSGNSKATYTMGAKAVVTATPKAFEGKGKGTPVGAVQVPPSKVKVTGTKGKAHSDFDLSSAAVVVGVGRGFKQQGDIKLAEELAKCFPGGAVGCSRPIAADLKWLGEEHWIGLSGHAIKPKAYIACGVSGQIQHIAGIRGAKLIVAINTNKDAPIFQVADYGVVGDLYQVLPKLTALLKK
ncbi:MAG TPA: electron transfer flavoprotein subunit alpha/FixB family protein [Candidatus Thermoplasmatota archaeon]|nr:electron transfer flavoprotein subunit alpha/FixB family protein [Candidatus Thermoplasmatota archaeon]